jgi:hypothetical protein
MKISASAVEARSCYRIPIGYQFEEDGRFHVLKETDEGNV